ncbi:F-box protein At3g07870-like [Salvia hispanica]|uniref:F-box protein At3g07870-like n=1 Tax=Salvia hispanica TaxID=49212 RepID=UPI0020098CBB|nr:F-box protein At3g07870-like [Salvia hispanica]
MTRKYKVVRIFGEKSLEEECKYGCQVYTVGTGSWRKVPFGDSLRLCDDVGGVLVNGNLHWTAKETRRGSGEWICCFDLETELFSNFPAPPLSSSTGRSLCVLRDCLCVSDISNTDGCIIIWLMEENEHGWTKIFVIPDVDRLPIVEVWPIRIFENGDVLMECEDGTLFCYSNKTKTFDYDIVSQEYRAPFPSTFVYAPSFVSLKSFAMENAWWLDVPPTYYIGVYESMTHIPDDLVSNADASCRIPTTGLNDFDEFCLVKDFAVN